MIPLALLLAVAPPCPPRAAADPCPQLPPAAVCAEYAAFSRAHAEWAWQQHVLYPSEARAESYARAAEGCAFAWSMAAMLRGVGRTGPYFGHSGRPELAWFSTGPVEETLAVWIGEDDFAAGVMPPPSPGWAGPYWGKP